MSACAEFRFPELLTTYVHGVLAALTRTGHHAEAVVYAQALWDWADGVEYRSLGELGGTVGLSFRQAQKSLDRLQAFGLVQVNPSVTDGRWELVLVVNPSKLAAFEAQIGTVGSVRAARQVSEISDKTRWLATLFRVPDSIVDKSVSPCYVSVYDSGTALALTTTANYTAGVVPTAYEMGEVTTYESAEVTTKADIAIASPAPARVGSRGNRSSPRGGSHGNGEPSDVGEGPGPKKAEGDAKPKRRRRKETPTTSHDFKQHSMDEIRQLEPERFPVIERVHTEWCRILGASFALTPWRYAAWRLALVESGYTEDQLLRAAPGVRDDDWWRSRCADPHQMFTGNPNKIERFFPENRMPGTIDRFGRGVTASTNTFTF